MQVPLFFKEIIDTLNIPLDAQSTVWVVCGSVVLACMPFSFTFAFNAEPMPRTPDGAARIGATLFGELLNAVFANVGQRAVRTVARQTFEHLLHLDLKFHLSRQTGGLTRAIDRGTKYVRPPQNFLCLNSLSWHVP